MKKYLIIICLLATASNAKKVSIQERLAKLEQTIEQQAANRVNSGDIVVQNQQLQQQIAELKGIIEEQNHQIKNLKDKQKLLYIDIDSRLAELEARPLNANNTGNQTVLPNETQVENQVESIEVDNSNNNTSASTEATSTAPTVSSVQNDYDIAFAHLRAGRFLESARAFEDFVQNHPENELTDNAYYWLGESYYVKRQYPQALAAFQSLTNKFPSSKKVADAWLKIGYSYFEMDDLIRAEESLKKVISDFPNTSIARLAQNRLNQLQRDN